MVEPLKARGGSNPLPLDGPLLSTQDVGDYLRMSVVAVRQVVEAEDSELGNVLRGNLVALSPRRRYIRRAPFLRWLNEKAGACVEGNTDSAGGGLAKD